MKAPTCTHPNLLFGVTHVSFRTQSNTPHKLSSSVLKRLSRRLKTSSTPSMLLNSGFEGFYMASTADGAAHYFELGTVRNLPAPDPPDVPICPRRTCARRIVLWKTTFSQGHVYASAFPEPEFQSLLTHLGPGSELRNLLEQAIAKIPTARPLKVMGDPAQNQ